MVKTMIIDDEPLAASLVQEYLEAYPEFEITGIYQNGFEGLKAIQESKPDLIFLDIQMPKLNGFEMLELLEDPPAVIFTTAFDAYALKAFDAHAVDYLLKPFSSERFKKALEKFLLLGNTSAVESILKKEAPVLGENIQRVVLKDRNEIKIIPVSEIQYLEANDDYVNLHSSQGKFLKNKTLSYFEKSLPNDLFVRVHRSYIVKIDQIHRIEPLEKDSYILRLRSGQTIPVSKTGLPKLKSVLGI